jgi:ABC-type uncharacterized transport system fused permease/ATPase subunit
VWFNFLGRDFYNALAEKDVDGFKLQLIKYLCGFVLGIPVFVFADFYQVIIYDQQPASCSWVHTGGWVGRAHTHTDSSSSCMHTRPMHTKASA